VLPPYPGEQSELCRHSGTDSAEGLAEECGIPIRLCQDGHRHHMAHPLGWIS
jgi:hypothetical protein